MTKIKTPLSTLMYPFLTGTGRNTAMPDSPERRQFVVSILLSKDSEELKKISALIDEEWAIYKTKAKLKPATKPATNGIRPVLHPDTGEETDEVMVTFKTNVFDKDGKIKKLRLYDHKGLDITDYINEQSWTIGNGSKAIVHGTASGNDIGGKHKVSLYLNAVQLAYIEKYESSGISIDDLDDLEGEDIL